MPFVTDFFDNHLRNLMNRPLLDGYETYSVECGIYFRDRDETWRLSVDGGQIIDINGPLDEVADVPVRFVVDEPVFFEIVTTEISPQKAFFARRTEIQGNLFEGMKLAKLLSLFFAKYPYRPNKEAS